MTRRFAVLAVLFGVVLAGCSVPVALPSAGGTDGAPSTESVGAAPERTPISSATTQGEREGTAVPATANPYDEETLTVAVDARNVSAGREVRPLIRRALGYWEANSRWYAGYSIEYDLLGAGADTSDADVVVRFVSDIEDCGREQHVAGCAPYVTSGPVDRPAIVRVSTGYSDDSTELVLKHELGHTLGLGHDDEPAEVMSAQKTLTTPPQTDASDREFAWNHSTLSVYVDYSGVEDRRGAERQVDAALGYFDDGAEGTVPENVSFVGASSPDRADVVIRFTEQSPCGAGQGSCGRVGGYDPDGDDAVETYTKLEISLADLDTDAIAWHVARWVGVGLSLDTDDEYPEPLRESASFGERRSEWWR